MKRPSLLALACLLLACALSAAGQRLSNGITLVVDRDTVPPLIVAQATVRKLTSASVCDCQKRRERPRRREPDFPVWYPRDPGYGYTTYYAPYVRYGVIPTLSGYLTTYAYPSGYYGHRIGRYGTTRIVLGGRR